MPTPNHTHHLHTLHLAHIVHTHTYHTHYTFTPTTHTTHPHLAHTLHTHIYHTHLVGMGHQQYSLVWEVVVEIRNDLHCHVRLPGTWWSDDEGQSWLHARVDGLHLSGSEPDGVSEQEDQLAKVIYYTTMWNRLFQYNVGYPIPHTYTEYPLYTHTHCVPLRLIVGYSSIT